MRFCFDLWRNYGDDYLMASNIHHFNNWQQKWNIKSILFQCKLSKHIYSLLKEQI